jgi:hypothetical protein
MLKLFSALLISFFMASGWAAVLPVGPAAPDGIVGKPKWVTPQWAERHLYAIRSPLMKGSHTDHVVSLYFFGEYQDRTLVGLERVKGDDYQQYFSLLLFEKQKLVGYYQNVASFPSGVDDKGVVIFPELYTPQPQKSGQIFSIATDDFYPLCLGKEASCVEWVTVEK